MHPWHKESLEDPSPAELVAAVASKLPPRQREILDALQDGLKPVEAARQLGIRPSRIYSVRWQIGWRLHNEAARRKALTRIGRL